MELIKVNNVYYLVAKHIGVLTSGNKSDIVSFLLTKKAGYILQ